MAKAKSPKARSNTKTLTSKQLNAIEQLVQGKTVAETAKAVKVSPSTVSRWKNENPYFVTKLNQERQERWRSARERLRAMYHQALDTIADAMANGDTRAAMFVVKALIEKDPPAGDTCVEDWIDHEVDRAEELEQNVSMKSLLNLGRSSSGDTLRAELRKKWL